MHGKGEWRVPPGAGRHIHFLLTVTNYYQLDGLEQYTFILLQS